MADSKHTSVTAGKNNPKYASNDSSGKKGKVPPHPGVVYTVKRAAETDGHSWHVFVSSNRLFVFNGLELVKDTAKRKEVRFLYSFLKQKPDIRFWLYPGCEETDDLTPDEYTPRYPCIEFVPVTDDEENIMRTWRKPDWFKHFWMVPLEEPEYFNMFGREVIGISEIELFNGRGTYTATWCDGCGKPYEGYIKGDPRRRYCSDECRRKAYAEKRQHLNEFKRMRRLETLRCQICGGLFEARAGAKFCGNRCRQANYRKTNRG